MKKLFSLLFAMLLVMGCYAAKTTDNVAQVTKDVKEAVTTTHQDVKDVVTTVHEDAKDIISTVYGDSKALAQNLYPEVKSAVIQIAKGIGVAAEHLYYVLVKKYVVDGIVASIPFILGLILVIIGWIKTEKYVKTHDKIKWHILYPACILITGIISLCVTDYNTMFMGLINPEYGAINYILEFTKEMVK